MTSDETTLYSDVLEKRREWALTSLSLSQDSSLQQKTQWYAHTNPHDNCFSAKQTTCHAVADGKSLRKEVENASKRSSANVLWVSNITVFASAAINKTELSTMKKHIRQYGKGRFRSCYSGSEKVTRLKSLFVWVYRDVVMRLLLPAFFPLSFSHKGEHGEH